MVIARRYLLGALAMGGLAPFGHLSASDEAVVFDKPAQIYTESSVLGNGRIGGMVFGGVDEERIVLNETGMWSGSPVEGDRPDAVKYLPEIRRLILEGRQDEAEALVKEQFTCLPEVSQTTGAHKTTGRAPGKGSSTPFGCYQTLGDLKLKFPQGGEFSNYHRELDLASAVTVTTYERDGVKFTREAFVSAPDEVLVLRLTASKPGQLSFTTSLNRAERFQTKAIGKDALAMTGRLYDGKDGENVGYAARVRAITKGGTVSTEGDVLKVENADEVLLLLAAITDIKTFSGRRSDDPAATAGEDIQKASAKSFAALREAHVADYRKYYDRTSLQLGPEKGNEEAGTTYDRLKAFAEGAADPGLAALYFNFNRYLLISSSRPGGLPPNLQGIWADEIQTAWNGDWHLDINLEMAYWGAEVANLGDLTEPLFKFVEYLQEPGAKTAKAYYGADGWIVHTVTNPWGFTSPGWNPGWATYVGSGAWLCQHLWDHYLFNLDRAYLEKAYPILRGSAEFYSDILFDYPKNNWLVTGPSSSPENSFYIGDTKKRAGVCAGPTADMQQIRYLFEATIEASKILGQDSDLRATLEKQLPRLVPTRVNSFGGIQEWVEDVTEVAPQHRHIMPLWGLYPGHEISVKKTPHLAEAARKTLARRAEGDARVGSWAFAYKILFWARLGDAEKAYHYLRAGLKPVAPESIHVAAGGGVYPNLLCAWPPYQFDGNQGTLAGIGELLIQSHEDGIRLLPTLPAEWPEGSVKGLRARGGFTVDFAWKANALDSATVKGTPGASVQVSSGNKSATVKIPSGGSVRLDSNLKTLS